MDMRAVPVLYRNKEQCCGCGLCRAVCPAGAIEMCADEEGFLYPRIRASACIRCGRCTASCVFQRDSRGVRG